MFYIDVGIYFRDIGLNEVLLKLIPPISFDFNVAITKFPITYYISVRKCCYTATTKKKYKSVCLTENLI